MKSFIKFISEAAPINPVTSSDRALGVAGGNLLGSPSTNVINVPQSSATTGSMGFDIDPATVSNLHAEIINSGRNPENYNSTYSATTDLRTDRNNQDNQSVHFRMLQSMFNQLPPESGMNGTAAMDMANDLSVNGFKVDEIYDAMIKFYQEQSKQQGLDVNPYHAMNNIISSMKANQQGLQQKQANINTFDPLADLKKYKLFAPVSPDEYGGEEVGEGGDYTGTDAIYGS